MSIDPNAKRSKGILIRLRARWWAAVGLCVLILLGGFLVFNQGHPRSNPFQWILQSTVIMICVLGLLRYGLGWNYQPEQKVLRSTLGYGTWLTIIRGALIAVLAGCLFQPWPPSMFNPAGKSWIPGLVYILASILDYLDGLIARTSDHESRLGAFLDINIDALGLLIAPLLAVCYGQLPIVYLSVGAAYYLFMSGIRLRKKYSKVVIELMPRRSARLIAGFQMGFVGLSLLPVFSPSATTMAAYVFMIPLLAGFVRDWCFVCGYLTPNRLRRGNED